MCTRATSARLIAINHSRKFLLIFPPTCKTWSCPDCSKRKKTELSLSSRNVVTTILDLGCAVFFCTITSHEKLYRPEHMRFVFKKAWPNLRKRLEYHTGFFCYFGLPEGVTDKRLHFHFLTTTDMTERLLKDEARTSGFGYIADVEPVNSGARASWYITKYVAKSLETEQWPPNFKRVRHSQTWPEIEREAAYVDWDFFKMEKDTTVGQTLAYWHSRGFEGHYTTGERAWEIVRSIG